MKTQTPSPLLFLVASVAFAIAIVPVMAEDKHDHGHDHAKKESGPNGGRILTSIEPHAEFLVTEDRKVKITFLDETNKAVPAGDQVVNVTAGERANPTKLTFAKSGDVLVSEQVLPEGNDYPTVVQIKASPDAKPAVEKFNLNMSKCPECDALEYACTCSH
jgi:hypothetical protein